MTKHLHYLFWADELGPYDSELTLLYQKLSKFKDITNADAEGTVREHLSLFIENEKQELAIRQAGNASSELETEAQIAQRQLKLRYKSYLLLLLDLLRQSWVLTCQDGSIFLTPPLWDECVPGNDAAQLQKAAMRKSLDYERRTQLEKSSVRDFIRIMERKRSFNGRTVSIQSLYADGAHLASDLADVALLADENAQYEAICRVVQPYLQLVTAGSRCEHTGFLLNDIWRYIRYTWSIPYNSTPGRNMFYLVRDAARPFHPIIGIGALGSSMVQLTERDDIIGWTFKATLKRIHRPEFTSEEAEQIVQMMTSTVQAGLSDLATSDLVSPEELTSPSEETLSKLRDIVTAVRSERQNILKKKQKVFLKKKVLDEEKKKQRTPYGQLSYVTEGGDSDAQPVPSSPNLDRALKNLDAELAHLDSLAQKALFRSKRAETLHNLLRARYTLTHAEKLASSEGFRSFVKNAAGQQTLQTLLRENKKRKVGINMMDIIICGAVPPYNYLLGGKLVAMLMASPTVVFDYKQKYADYASNIASQMKEGAVYREPDLVFLGTTSLYQSGSSQYNRISIPLEDGKTFLRYINYGRTLGFGSVHFSEETVRTLTELQASIEQATLINNRFGEGVNPKFRRVRAGLSHIGLPNSDEFLNNRSRRIIYGVPLGKATYDFLRGEADDPKYFFDVSSPEHVASGTQSIKEFWAKRWLLMRIKNQRVLQEVSSFHKSDALLSREFINGSGIAIEPPVPEEAENGPKGPDDIQQFPLFEGALE